MKQYMGYFDGRGRRHVGVVIPGRRIPDMLDPRREHMDYDGALYMWGALKPGTMQLAFALCADALGDIRRARETHGALAIYFLKDLWPGGEFRVSDIVIHALIEKYERETPVIDIEVPTPSLARAS